MTATPWNALLFSPLSRTSLAAFGLSPIFGGKVRGIGKVFAAPVSFHFFFLLFCLANVAHF